MQLGLRIAQTQKVTKVKVRTSPLEERWRRGLFCRGGNKWQTGY